MDDLPEHEIQGQIWAYYKPRHTHTWNMLVLSWRDLDQSMDIHDDPFEIEYLWENFILRLWLYRTIIKTLTKLPAVNDSTAEILKKFDRVFDANGKNNLKALRDMVEHFDDYAAGTGRGPATRDDDLDPWRSFSKDRYERGQFVLERKRSYDAAIQLRSDAKRVSDDFIHWYKSTKDKSN